MIFLFVVQRGDDRHDNDTMVFMKQFFSHKIKSKSKCNTVYIHDIGLIKKHKTRSKTTRVKFFDIYY